MTYVDTIKATVRRVDWQEPGWTEEAEGGGWDTVVPLFEGPIAAFRAADHQGVSRESVRRNYNGGGLYTDDDENLSALSYAVWEACQENGSEPGVPMMNYAYDLDPEPDADEARRFAALLWDLPVEIVNLSDEYVFALSGGGMDRSWEIAEADMRCGYRVPGWIELPRMADRPRGEGDLAIVRAVIETQQILEDWSGRAGVRARQMLADYEEAQS